MKAFLCRTVFAICMCVAFLACAIFAVPTARTASANSAAPWEEGVTGDGVYAVREYSVLEVQSEKLVFDINTLPSLEKGQIYDARVTAEYTFYNPTEESLTTQMAFPFGRKPAYADNLSVAYIQNPVLVNGQPVAHQVRHTYGLFEEFYESVRDIRDDYIADDFFTPDLPVTIYTATVNFTDSADIDGRVALRLDGAPALGGGTRCIGPFQSDATSDAYNVWEVLSDGESAVFYVLGEDVPLDEWEWFTSAWSDRVEGHIRTDSEISFATAKSTLGDIIFANYADDCGISRIDWYNGVMLHKLAVERGDFSYLSWFSPLNVSPEDFNAWYVYTVQTAPYSSFTNSVTAPLYPTVHFNFAPDVYKYVYYLSPAANWADFGTLDVEINTPCFQYGDEYYNSATFSRTEGGYSAHFDSLPEGELYFSLCSVQTPGTEDERPYEGYGGNIALTILYVLIGFVVLLVIAAIVAVVLIVMRVKKKKGGKRE